MSTPAGGAGVHTALDDPSLVDKDQTLVRAGVVEVAAEDRMTVVVEDDGGAMLNFVLSTDCDWLQLDGKDQMTGGEEQKNR